MEHAIPRYVKEDGRKLLLVDEKPFILLSGEAHNSSSSSTEYMEPIWEKLKGIHLNSVLLPVTWQMVEPEEGQFCFDVIDGLIKQARAHEMKIGILWFGAWKNGNCSYAPDWVKTDTERFHRAEGRKGKRFMNIRFHDFRMPYTTLSAFCEETTKADAKAFAALMKHLKEYDTERTVILVQVENETGLLGAGRDHSDEADKAFAEKVPARLIEFLVTHRENLIEEIRESLDRKLTGSWQEVFGEVADEVFMAWHTARHVEAVAQAGKAEYPLPMYANCWLEQGGRPGEYPSGGPVHRVMEVWMAAAPSLDWFAPDIYVPDFCDVCDRYVKLDNPLFIPEVALHGGAGARLIYAVGHHHALCFAPFGIEDIGYLADTTLGAGVGMDASDTALKNAMDAGVYGRINQLLDELMPLLTERYSTKELQAVIQENPKEWTMPFGNTEISAYFDMPGLTVKQGACLVLRVAENEYYLLGYGCMPRFTSLDEEHPYMEYLSIEEGEFVDGAWKTLRILNGDEEYIRINEPTLLHIRTHLYN